LLKNIKIPTLGGIPKIPKLFDFWQILAVFISLDRFWQILIVLSRFGQIVADSPAFGYG
jgi:hypothetical protein